MYLFPVCKFFDPEEQVPMGSLSRPVTAYYTCYHTGHNEYTDDHEGSLHHMSVPLILPSTMLIAIAEMNIAVSMYNKSI